MIQDIYPHFINNQFVANVTPGGNAYLIHFRENNVLIKSGVEGDFLAQIKDLSVEPEMSSCTYLFSLNNVPCFLYQADFELNNDALDYRDIGFFRTTTNKETAWATLIAWHLFKWYSEHKFCGTCGAPTLHKVDERAVQCNKCNSVYYPKISPAVIVAVLNEDKLLLANNANFRSGWFSLIAGYADVGETLEETVRREVKEEVGLDVGNIRYYKSQPWALSGSLMIGFIAEVFDKAQPIQTDGHEITNAEWFSADNLPEHPSAEISIAGEMIELFKNGKLI